MGKKYFVYDQESSLEIFDTEEKAKAFAEDILDCYRTDAGEGWDEAVEQVCWGEIKQETKMGEKQPIENSEFDYIVDYSFVDVDDEEVTELFPGTNELLDNLGT